MTAHVPNPRDTGGASAIVYEPEAKALFARASAPVPTARKAIINKAIKAIKDAGCWSQLATLNVFVAHERNFSLLNWVGTPAYDAQVTGTPTFEADKGWSGFSAANRITVPITSALLVGAGQPASCGMFYGGQFTRTGVGSTSTNILESIDSTTFNLLSYNPSGQGLHFAAGGVNYNVNFADSSSYVLGTNTNNVVLNGATISSGGSSNTAWNKIRTGATPLGLVRLQIIAAAYSTVTIAQMRAISSILYQLLRDLNAAEP